MSHPSTIMLPKAESMKAWKVGSELHQLKNMTTGLQRPYSMMNTTFHLSPSLMQMVLYPHQMSILEHNFAPMSLLMRVEMRGRG